MLFRRKYTKYQFSILLRKLHMAAWIFGALLTMYCLLRCIAALDGALDDLSKFRDLGSSKTFHYHLQNNGFFREVIPFLGVGIEWFHYIVQCHRTEQKKKTAGGIWILGILLVVHIAMWLYAGTLPLPDLPSWELVKLPVVQYRRFANMTIFPAVVYFALYFLRMRNTKS